MTDRDLHEIWQKIVKKRCEALRDKCGGLLIAENAEEEIYTYYQEICDYAHKHYMKDPDGNLNRYKIGGSLIIAILKTKPLKKVDEKFYKEPNTAWTLNESVALYTALSVIRSFIMNDAKKNPSEDNLFKRDIFNEIPIDSAKRESWEVELYHLRQEGCYNVLVLAHQLEDFVEKAVMKETLKRLKSAE